jgi:hypothetical protein
MNVDINFNILPISASYRKKTKRPVLDARAIIISATTPGYKLAPEDIEPLRAKLKSKGLASSREIIKFTLKLYRMTWGVLQGDEESVDQMRRAKAAGNGWVIKPLEYLEKDKITQEQILELIEKQEIQKTLADSILSVPQQALPEEIPPYLMPIAEAANAQIQNYLKNLSIKIEELLAERCSTCEKRKRSGIYLDNLNDCQNELRILQSQNKCLSDKLQAKEIEFRLLEEKTKALLADKK